MVDIGHILDEPYVNNGCYTVPDGYFNTLHDRIMKRVDEKVLCSDTPVKKKTAKLRILSVNPWVRFAAAACFVGVIVLFGIGLFNHHNDTENRFAEHQENTVSEQYYNDCMEYAMVDNDDIYAYLTEQ